MSDWNKHFISNLEGKFKTILKYVEVSVTSASDE